MLKGSLGKGFLGGGKGWANVFQPAALQAFAWSFNKIRLGKSSLIFSVSTIVPVKRKTLSKTDSVRSVSALATRVHIMLH